MKIMDLSGDDGEYQVETVASSKTKKSKQGRLPFQTLSRDSPVANKKRKSVASPDVRNAKQAKVNTKENSFKVSKKTEDEEIIVIDEEIEEGKEENKINEANDIKDCSKQSVSTETPESKSKKSTPGKGSVKNKKSEPKIQSNSLIKFFKKIDSKDAKNEKSPSVSENKEESKKKISVNNNPKESEISQDEKKSKQYGKEDSGKKSSVNNKSKEQEKSQDEKKSKQNSDTESTKVPAKKLDNESDNDELEEAIVDVESDEDSKKNSEESDNSLNGEDSKSKSELNDTSNMDVDSDNSLSDEDDDDNDKSDTDSKKTEHEETDGKDDTNRNSEVQLTTPKRSKLLNSSGKGKKLTPKQIERKLEIQKQKESRAKQRLEREKKLQKERENRKKEKEEKRREREEKEKMLKEQKKKEKEQKELKKQAENEQKQKEKEAKEEERRKREEAREEEKRRKEEERLEAERRKQKAASNFASFFVAKKPAETKPIEEDNKVERRNFMPFEIKADMRVAPTVRRNLSESEKIELDKMIKSSAVNKSKLYINNIKGKEYNIRKSERTWPYEANDDIIILEDEEEENSNVVQASNAPGEKHRAKLFLFHENRRPPYWGTWRKKSKAVHSRRPFGKDTQWFDYEVDSDDEWEEEEPGESLRGSDDEKDEENPEENEYDVDNDFMVPHGYLSDEEIGADEEDEDDELNPEKQEKKLKILGEQFEAERNTKTTKLKPKVIGCVWLNKENTYPESTPSHSVKFLTPRHAWVRDIPVTLTPPADADGANDADAGTSSSRQSVALSARKAQSLEEATPDLVRLVHGNTHGRAFLIQEFLEYWSKKMEGNKPLTKARLKQRITEIATWTTCTEAGPLQNKQCWIVSEEMQKKYLPEEKLAFPNQWTYCLVPRKRSVAAESSEKTEEKEKKSVPLITQFTKTLTTEEMQKQLAEKPTPSSLKTVEKSATSSASKAITPINRPPKRVALISVPRGETFPKSPRVSLMDIFVTKDGSNVKKDTQITKSLNGDDDDDIMIIDDDEEEKDKVSTVSVSSETKIVKETNNSENKTESKSDVDVEMKEEKEVDLKNLSSASSDVDIIEI